jgi:peptidyl-prolyl cis-trans isomerase B (cyclophilin B)
MKKIFFICLLSFVSCKSIHEKTHPVGNIETPLGSIYFWLHNETPKHKASFIKLANDNYWDNLSFNRIIEDFVIQGGCPDTPEGFDESHYLIDPEFPPNLKHIYGAVGMGRDDNPEKKSAGCQFYIVHSEEIARLNQNYTIFGQMFKGFDVLDKIATLPTDSFDAPLEKVPIKVSVLVLNEKELIALGAASFVN